jgi:selenoprotein W-related protein
LAADLKDKFGVDARLIESGGGVFEVVIDGELVFSKKELSRFPEHSEIYSAIEDRQV